MQIIQNIRNRGTVLMAILISLCLLGFILMDANSGGSSFFGDSNVNTVGSINGKDIEIIDFNKRMNMLELQEEQRTGRKPTGSMSYQIREQLWNQVVAENIIFDEAKKLGIEFTPKELSTILLSNHPNNPFLQEQGMVDPTTGKLDVAKAQSVLNEIKKAKEDRREEINAQLVDPLKLSTVAGKYINMLGASAYYPGWMQEQDAANMNNFATISYVTVPYNEISDSAVKVTDADINAYVQKNKELFKQEAGRRISYVAISQLPTGADSAAQREEIAKLKDAFATDSDAKSFLARNGSIVQFQDDYLPKSRIPTSMIDSIVSLPAGSVYGPYADQGAYILAKNLGSKMQPDSASARHILISTVDPQTGQQVRSDADAKNLADSIYNAIKGGTDFVVMAIQYSADGSRERGGDLGTFSYGSMVPEFNNFVFTNPVGTMGVVKTQFGYHIIDIESQTPYKPAYKIAFLAKEIIPSETTLSNSTILSTKAAASKNSKELADFASKNGLSFVQVPVTVKENDHMVGAMDDARQLVRWAFEAKPGQVSEPYNIGDEFIVATLDKEIKEGYQDAADARSGAEAIVRNNKKAEIIKTKLGANPTLESAAAAYQKQVLTVGEDSSLTMSANIVNGLGIEPEVIGASFNKAYQAKPSPAFAGTGGVYVIKVNSIQTKAPLMAAEEQVKNKMMALRQTASNWYDGLKKQATIKDLRSKVF